MGVERMAQLIREQATACRSLGSPFYGALLDRVADDVLADGPALAALAGHEEDPGPSALALRLMGTVHRMVLAGEVLELARHYASVGGDGDPGAAWEPLRAVLAERVDEVRAGVASPPQTNEVGRSAGLLGGLLHALAGRSAPVRLWEIGASAGLNLRADLFQYVAADGATWGPPSPVRLDPAWDRVPDGPPHLEVIERVGADPSPIDPTSADGELRLASYVWPDQLERMVRLRAAVAVAREHPAGLVRASAAQLLAGLELREAAVTVVWHSVMWQYLDAQEQTAVRARLDALGAAATSAAPLVHVAFEPRRLVPGGRHRFVIAVRRWPEGTDDVVGEAPPHGVPVSWGPPTP